MTDHFLNIYQNQAQAYHQLIAPEDVAGNLHRALEGVTPLTGKRILDLGCGTGRLPLLLANQASQMVGLDLHGAMLRENQSQRERVKGRWGLLQGTVEMLPIVDGWAEVVTSGWVIGHFPRWYEMDWQVHITRVLQEMHRVVSKPGAIIIIETLSTGSLTPTPPSPGLAAYYTWLEEEWGFSRQEIQTDYQFASVEEAVARTEFFFGPTLAAHIRANNWSRLPEWTGVWGKVIV